MESWEDFYNNLDFRGIPQGQSWQDEISSANAPYNTGPAQPRPRPLPIDEQPWGQQISTMAYGDERTPSVPKFWSDLLTQWMPSAVSRLWNQDNSWGDTLWR